jgi:aspartate/methionine/tyrosine aminotransferase
MYQRKRDALLEILREAGFECLVPGGAYYIMCDITPFGFESDETFTKYLIEQVGVAPVPGYSFFHDPAAGRRYVRFAFPKRDETFAEVRRRLGALRPRAGVSLGSAAGPGSAGT